MKLIIENLVHAIFPFVSRLYKRLHILETTLAQLKPLFHGPGNQPIGIMNRPVGQDWGDPRNLLALIKPMTMVDAACRRYGKHNDGGYIMPVPRREDSVAYSFGIKDDVSWDLAMADLGISIFQYDHTISHLPVTHPLFHFFRTGVGPVTSPNENLMSIDDMLAANGHRDHGNIIMKMDIQGAEWPSLNSLETETFLLFSIIVIEIHHLSRYALDQNFCATVNAVLGRINRSHQCVHVHANNYSPATFVDGILIPGVFELTYIRRDLTTFNTSYATYPLAIDQPNNASLPDLFLGACGLWNVDECLR